MTRPRRTTLLLVALLFLSPFLVALVLNRLGWHPQATRNNGELIEPPQPLGELVLRERDGSGADTLPLVNMDHRWTLIVRLPPACDEHCVARMDELHRVRYSLGRHAPKLAVRLIAPAATTQVPESMRVLDDASVATLEAASPQIAQAPAWTGFLVDDKAYLMMRFPPELEARLLRRDLGRLVR